MPPSNLSLQHRSSRRVPRALAAAVVAIVAAATSSACSDGSVDSLTGGGGGGSGSGGSGSGGGGSGGWDGTGSGGGFGTGTTADGGASVDAGSASAIAAKAAFEALLPLFSQSCGGPCHVMGAGSAPTYLGPPDAYASIKAFGGIVVADVGTSLVLTKGPHEGPDLVDPLRTEITSWLTLEAALITTTSLPQTAPFSVTTGANTVDLAPAGVAGAKLTFTAAVSGDVLTMTNIQIVAPATTGVHIVFPIFDDLPANNGPETQDMSFSNADVTVAAGQSASLYPGILVLTGWATTDQMKIELTKFAAVTVAAADAGASTGGCKSVASFTSDVVPQIQANTCLNCHNTGGSGNASLDLSGLAATPPDDTGACAQALNRADVTTPAMSDLILAPTGHVANHPFKTASQAFVTAVEAWLANEH
jgi:cytochrome c553